MAKKQTTKTFSIQGFDAAAYKQTEAYVQAIDSFYQKAVLEFAQIATKLNIDPEKPFAFSDYPGTSAAVQKIVNELAAKMQAVIKNGSRKQWLYACQKNDEFIATILDTTKISKKTLEKYQNRNLEALDSFQKRKINGLDLSQRVWKYTDQLKGSMELGIDVAIGEGTSAAKLSKELRKYLVDPDNLFRRVRDKRGNLVLSKRAAAFKPGQGTYRSSYKNAMRLTRSEINMAYKVSDQLRWQQLDFVVGYEIKLSNNHTLNGEPFVDICDRLVGKYPKNFKFKGWHPQCRCLVVPILQDPDEFDNDELNDLKSALNGKEYPKFASRQTIADVPDSFKGWIKENAERAKNWASQPYFIRDNFKGGTIEGGLNFASKPIQVVKPTIQAPEPKLKEVKEPVPNRIPTEFSEGSEYIKGTKIKFNNDFFSLLDPARQVKVRFVNSDQSYHQAGTVQIGKGQRASMSDWYKERVVYHEYGHAIDFQRNLRFKEDIRNLMDTHKSLLKKKETYTRIEKRYSYDEGRWINNKVSTEMPKIAKISMRLDAIFGKVRSMSPDVFTKRGIRKHDVIEAIAATQDTIMSLNPNYGWGHTKSYFKHPGMKEAEFLAHAFENAFGGNPVMKKYLPELYEEMIKYIRSLK